MDELKAAKHYEKENWGSVMRNNRYSRVTDRAAYISKLEQSNIGKDVDPAKARRFHKVYN